MLLRLPKGLPVTGDCHLDGRFGQDLIRGTQAVGEFCQDGVGLFPEWFQMPEGSGYPPERKSTRMRRLTSKGIRAGPPQGGL